MRPLLKFVLLPNFTLLFKIFKFTALLSTILFNKVICCLKCAHLFRILAYIYCTDYFLNIATTYYYKVQMQKIPFDSKEYYECGRTLADLNNI